jgi:hypothetical protein
MKRVAHFASGAGDVSVDHDDRRLRRAVPMPVDRWRLANLISNFSPGAACCLSERSRLAFEVDSSLHRFGRQAAASVAGARRRAGLRPPLRTSAMEGTETLHSAATCLLVRFSISTAPLMMRRARRGRVC